MKIILGALKDKLLKEHFKNQNSLTNYRLVSATCGVPSNNTGFFALISKGEADLRDKCIDE